VRAAHGAMEGVIYPAPSFSDEFIKRYEGRFNGEYPELISGNVYDFVQMIAASVARNRCSREEIRDDLENLKHFDGVLGHYGINDTHEFRFDVKLKQIRNGRFEKKR